MQANFCHNYYRKRAGTDALGPQITSGMTAEMRERVQQALNTRTGETDSEAEEAEGERAGTVTQ